MQEHDLLATSWTWAGTEPIAERISAVGAAGFAGLSLTLGDLHEVRATTGFAELRRILDGAGIVWVELLRIVMWWSCSVRTA
ncbi:sugar phosphate isomerase/epimerase, partial [Bacillus sp. S34]|nr:sugar phosphate isomerase/epimerase [Bacillus sp. S34]